MITTIPFQGFYNSELSDNAESELDNLVDMMYSSLEGSVSKTKLLDILYSHANFSKAYAVLAVNYSYAFDEKASSIVGFALHLEFDEMVSPREYNFTTDRIFMKIPEESVLALFRMSEEANHHSFRQLVKERFTSREGFMSFYSPDIEEWLEKPIQEWDGNEVGALLEAVMFQEDCDSFENLEDEAIEYLASNGAFSNAVDDCIEWDKVVGALGLRSEAELWGMAEADFDFH